MYVLHTWNAKSLVWKFANWWDPLDSIELLIFKQIELLESIISYWCLPPKEQLT